MSQGLLSLVWTLLTCAAITQESAPAAVVPSDVAAIEKRTLLEDPNAALKRKAAEDLLKKKEQKFLIDTLSSSKDQGVLSAVIGAFTSAQQDDIVLEALPFMSLDDKDQLRRDASQYFDGLYRLPTKQKLVDAILAAANDTSQPMARRAGAVLVLGQFKELRRVPDLIALLEASEAKIPEPVVVKALSEITARNFGPRPAEWRAFYDANRSKTREQILEERARDLKQQLDERDQEVATQAELLIRANPEMLVSYLEHRDPRVRQVAISQIANLANASQAHPGAVDNARAKIIALLTERSTVYQDEDLARLIEAVGQSKLFSKEKPQATGSSERGEGKRTSEAGDSPQELVRLLESALASDSDRIRAAAASALRNFARDLVDPAPLLAAFVHAKSQPTPDVPLMQQLLRTLAVHWRTGDLSVFTDYLESAPPEIKLELLDTLAVIGDRSVLPALEAAMDPARLGTNFKLRFRAVAALGQVAGRLQATDPSLGNELVSVFGRGLQDEEAEVRVQCAQEIGRLNAQSGLDLLVDRLERKNERNQAVRDALIAAIAETAGGRRAALEILARTLAKEPKKIATGNGTVESKADDALHAAIAKVADSASAGERLSRWAWVARYLIDANAHSASAWALDNLLRRMPSPLPESLPEGLAPDLNTPDRIRFAMGSASLRAGQPASAAKAFMDITPAGVDELSKQPQFWQMRAELAESQAKFELAASSYEELAKRLKPGEAQYPEALSNAARAYLSAKQPERACLLMDNLLQSHPDDLDYLYLGGLVCMDKGDFSRALERLTKVFESDLPVDPRRRFDVLEKICEIYRVQGDKESPKRLLRNFKLPAALLDEFGPRLEQLKVQAGLP